MNLHCGFTGSDLRRRGSAELYVSMSMPKRFCEGHSKMFPSAPVCGHVAFTLVKNSPLSRLAAMDNKAMARGWESKSVEAQQADAAEANSTPRPRLTSEQAGRLRERQNLVMARTSIVRQLESASDPRYRALLEQTLKEVEDKLLHLPA